MAARKNRIQHDQKTREKIRTTQLINRLMDHIEGKVELTTSQVRAAEILIKKTLPDLTAVQVEADVEQRFVVSSSPEMSVEEWQEKYNQE